MNTESFADDTLHICVRLYRDRCKGSNLKSDRKRQRQGDLEPEEAGTIHPQ